MPLETKTFEIRDRATFIPVIVTKIQKDKRSEDLVPFEVLLNNEAENYLLGRAGWAGGQSLFYMTSLVNQKTARWPHDWGGPQTNRTYYHAHDYIQDNWDSLESGDVVDVEFILDEVDSPKTSERERMGLTYLQTLTEDE